VGEDLQTHEGYKDFISDVLGEHTEDEELFVTATKSTTAKEEAKQKKAKEFMRKIEAINEDNLKLLEEVTELEETYEASKEQAKRAKRNVMREIARNGVTHSHMRARKQRHSYSLEKVKELT